MPPDRTDAQTIRAAAPGPSAEALRTAYLELLKLALADLAGVRTMSVLRTLEGGVVARESTEEEIEFRANGKHWPLSGLSMAGLKRLDDLQHCVEAVVADDVDGDLIETGVWRGGASILMRAALDSLGADERTVWLADSFQGFPEPAEAGAEGGADLGLGGVDFLAASLEEVQANCARLGFERGLRFVPGFFEETLPGLRGRSWALIRLDGDSYEATRLGLESLYPTLSAGGFLIVDDYASVPECRRAVEEYRRDHEISEPIEQIDWTCVRWRRETAPEERTDAPPEVGQPAVAMRPVQRPDKPQVPTERERALELELAAVQERLGAAGSQPPTARELELERQVALLTDRLKNAQVDMAMLRGASDT